MNNGLNIAFFGSSLVSAYWNGAATYYRGITRALAGRGHRITFFEPDAFGRQQHRDGPDPSWARVVVYPARNERDVESALAQARPMDLIIKCSGVGVFDPFLESGVLELRRPGNMIMFWDVDAPATLDRIRKDPSEPFLKLIPRYDFIATYGGGDRVVRAYRALGARACTPSITPSIRLNITRFPRRPALNRIWHFWAIACRIGKRESRNFSFAPRLSGRTINSCSAVAVGATGPSLRT